MTCFFFHMPGCKLYVPYIEAILVLPWILPERQAMGKVPLGGCSLIVEQQTIINKSANGLLLQSAAVSSGIFSVYSATVLTV